MYWHLENEWSGPWLLQGRHGGHTEHNGGHCTCTGTWRMSGQAPGCCRVVMGGTQNTMGGTVHVLAPGELNTSSVGVQTILDPGYGF